MTMHLVNWTKSFKSIFEFLRVPVITGFFFSKLKGGLMPLLDFVKSEGGGGGGKKIQGGGGAVKNPGHSSDIFPDR